MERNFNEWLSGFRDSIADYGYYIDFEKVHRNVDNIKVELNILNSLIGSKNIEADFESLMRKYPEVLKCIPLLLAVRANEIYCQEKTAVIYMNSILVNIRRTVTLIMRDTSILCVKPDCLICWKTIS